MVTVSQNKNYNSLMLSIIAEKKSRLISKGVIPKGQPKQEFKLTEENILLTVSNMSNKVNSYQYRLLLSCP